MKPFCDILTMENFLLEDENKSLKNIFVLIAEFKFSSEPTSGENSILMGV